MRRFNWDEMRSYWEIHSSRYAQLDYERDPDGLGNVCQADAPLWLNEYYARFQRMAYQRLFSLVPACPSMCRAIDVGCGAGRWCRFLAGHGYDTVGIDLQPELVKMNKQRYPGISFYCSSIQDYPSDGSFDLLSSVTVIQHVPFEDQDEVIRKLREFLKPGGYAIVLENIHDQGYHVFANTIDGWVARFEKAGFSLVAFRRYDYSPLLRLLGFSLSNLVKFIPVARKEGSDAICTPEKLSAPSSQGTGSRRLLSRSYKTIQRAATWVDSIFEPVLVRGNFNLSTAHCGFLFKAT
jgi:2-polyprenyl-3-methyl-5-hydroxy-6-metoxy-1,4-benzoquinol methylase